MLIYNTNTSNTPIYYMGVPCTPHIVWLEHLIKCAYNTDLLVGHAHHMRCSRRDNFCIPNVVFNAHFILSSVTLQLQDLG